jgi:hypothetical protein
LGGTKETVYFSSSILAPSGGCFLAQKTTTNSQHHVRFARALNRSKQHFLESDQACARLIKGD